MYKTKNREVVRFLFELAQKLNKPLYEEYTPKILERRIETHNCFYEAFGYWDNKGFTSIAPIDYKDIKIISFEEMVAFIENFKPEPKPISIQFNEINVTIESDFINFSCNGDLSHPEMDTLIATYHKNFKKELDNLKS